MHIMMTIPSQLPFPQAQLLLHELNHRIGNEFCCAVSVVSLAAARSNNKEVKAALTDVAELLPPLCGGPSRSADPGTWDPHGRGGLSSQAVPVDQAIQAESHEDRPRPRSPPFMAAIGSMLATRNDRLRAHNKRGAACICRRRSGHDHGSASAPSARNRQPMTATTTATKSTCDGARFDRQVHNERYDLHGWNHNLSRLQVTAAGANFGKPTAARAVCDDGFPGSFRRAHPANQT